MDAITELLPWSTPSVTEVHQVHLLGAVFRGYVDLRAELQQSDLHGRPINPPRPGGRPAINPMWIESLRDELGDYLRAEKSADRAPKHDACLEWIRDRARAHGWTIGETVIRQRIIGPAFEAPG